MKRAFILMFALCAANAAFAQEPPQRPEAPPPAAAAPFAQREAWCQQFAAWFVASTPQTPAPPDVRDGHEFQIEFNSCKLDPQRYERDTRTEAQSQRRIATG